MHHTEKDPGPAGFVAGEGDAYDYIPDWMVIPGLYTTENQPDPLAVIELFTPDSSWTWFVLEYDPDERVAFGPVEGLETELGYISIEEMERATGPRGLRVERDEWFEPTPIRVTGVPGQVAQRRPLRRQSEGRYTGWRHTDARGAGT